MCGRDRNLHRKCQRKSNGSLSCRPREAEEKEGAGRVHILQAQSASEGKRKQAWKKAEFHTKILLSGKGMTDTTMKQI